MATGGSGGMDRSKYRNPDMPVGYDKKRPKLISSEGLFWIMNGEVITLIDLLDESDVDHRPDNDELEYFAPTDSDEEEATVVEKSSKKKKDDVKIKKEPSENDYQKMYQNKKKELESKGSSPIQDFFEKIEIDPEKGAKKKKPRNIKKERHDSRSPSRSFKKSPSSRRNQSPSYRSRRSQSPSYRSRRSQSPSYRSRRSQSPSYRSKRSQSPSYRSKRSQSPSYRSRRSPSLSRRSRHSPPPSIRSGHNLVNYSRSPSPDIKIKEPKIKEEPPEFPEHLHGHYHCDVCNLTVNSLQILQTHQMGKKHIKAVKARQKAQVVSKSIPVATVSENESKYPKVTPGFKREKVATTSVIQDYVEQNLFKPCPGLNFIIEIRKLGKTDYYCKLCDCCCSTDSIMPHLNGYKHQINCLAHFKRDDYENLRNTPKFKAERQISAILSSIERKEGRGRISVEVEELDPTVDLLNLHKPSTSSRSQSSSRDHDRNQPSTSRGTGSCRPDPFDDSYEGSTLPSTSSSDFYCAVCQSHMNSLQMWEQHISGKRHLTNIKKLPGDKPSKTKTVKVLKEAHLLKRIRKELYNEPVVGLSEIRETEVLETKAHTYQCFLCGSCHTSIDILSHIISLKHRTKYLEHVHFPDLQVIYGMSEVMSYDLVKDMCAQVERDEGTGKPEVHVNKSGLW